MLYKVLNKEGYPIHGGTGNEPTEAELAARREREQQARDNASPANSAPNVSRLYR